MTQKDYTHLVLIVDRSGSMGENGLYLEAQKSINKIIKDQTAIPGKLTVSLYDFNTNYALRFGPVPGSEAPEYHMVPDGGTALIYSACKVIDETGIWLRSMADEGRPERVISVIVTDGEENSSHYHNSQPAIHQPWSTYNSLIPSGGVQWTSAELKRRIEEQTSKYGWDFIFPAAGIDAFSTASGYGITNSIQFQPTAKSYAATMDYASASIGTSRLTAQSVNSVMRNATVSASGEVTEEENEGTSNVSTTTESDTP